MAAPKAKSGVLDPGFVTEVTVAVDPFGSNRGVAVTLRANEGTIWCRIDGVDPEIEGDDSRPVIGVREFSVDEGLTEVTVKLISDTACPWSVEGSD